VELKGVLKAIAASEPSLPPIHPPQPPPAKVTTPNKDGLPPPARMVFLNLKESFWSPCQKKKRKSSMLDEIVVFSPNDTTLPTTHKTPQSLQTTTIQPTNQPINQPINQSIN
jgi:hypothetical protein